MSIYAKCKIPVAVRVPDYSLCSAQKNRDAQPTKILLVLTHIACSSSPRFIGRKRGTEKPSAFPYSAQPSWNTAENKRGNIAPHIHTWKTGRMLAELLFLTFRDDIHTPLLPFKVQWPMSRILFHGRTESLVGGRKQQYPQLTPPQGKRNHYNKGDIRAKSSKREASY